MLPRRHPLQVQAVLEELGISGELISARSLAMHAEARELVVAERGDDGREHLLVPAAAAAWKRLSAAARGDGVELRIASAFRSVERQAEIVREKLQSGLSVAAVLSVCAPPGFSEHHTGRAVDVDTPDCHPLDGAFAQTEGYRWLSLRAREFGFTLSYPQGNAHGYEYESGQHPHVRAAGPRPDAAPRAFARARHGAKRRVRDLRLCCAVLARRGRGGRRYARRGAVPGPRLRGVRHAGPAPAVCEHLRAVA